MQLSRQRAVVAAAETSIGSKAKLGCEDDEDDKVEAEEEEVEEEPLCRGSQLLAEVARGRRRSNRATSEPSAAKSTNLTAR